MTGLLHARCRLSAIEERDRDTHRNRRCVATSAVAAERMIPFHAAAKFELGLAVGADAVHGKPRRLRLVARRKAHRMIGNGAGDCGILRGQCVQIGQRGAGELAWQLPDDARVFGAAAGRIGPRRNQFSQRLSMPRPRLRHVRSAGVATGQPRLRRLHLLGEHGDVALPERLDLTVPGEAGEHTHDFEHDHLLGQPNLRLSRSRARVGLGDGIARAAAVVDGLLCHHCVSPSRRPVRSERRADAAESAGAGPRGKPAVAARRAHVAGGGDARIPAGARHADARLSGMPAIAFGEERGIVTHRRRDRGLERLISGDSRCPRDNEHRGDNPVR